MEEWKVRHEDQNGFHVTEWLTEGKARKVFGELKNSGTVFWAELVHSPLDENPDIGEIVITQFTSKVIDLFGRKLILPPRGQQPPAERKSYGQ